MDTSVDICNLKVGDQYVYPDEVRAAAGCQVGGVAQVQDVVTNIISGIIAALGIVCVIFIIYGGVQYMTAAGEPAKLQKAKHTILYACLGLIICVLAFAITNFIVGILNNPRA